MLQNPKKRPLAYFLTFTTYGTWLHGDNRTSVIRKTKNEAARQISPHLKLFNMMQHHLKENSYEMTRDERNIVLNTIKTSCKINRWFLHALHVRSNHVHAVIDADQLPEYIAGKFKANASRELKQLPKNQSRQKFWTRHASTQYLWSEHDMHFAMQYVIEQQGVKHAYAHAAWYQTDIDYLAIRETRTLLTCTREGGTPG
ncbi:MAG TPA: transposase [Coxiellaceae bacterium]|nr:transposase [Coxiellaceae bacterium]